MKVDGDVQIGEAARWAAKACAPLTGYPKNLLIMFAMIPALVCVTLGIPTLATEHWGAPSWLYLPLIVLIGWPLLFLFGQISRRWQVQRFARALIKRGISNPLPVAFETCADALVVKQGAQEWRTAWSAITDVNPVGPYWVFLAQGTPVYLPKRYFAEKSDEAIFLGDCLSRMSPASAERSKAATKLCQTGHPPVE